MEQKKGISDPILDKIESPQGGLMDTISWLLSLKRWKEIGELVDSLLEMVVELYHQLGLKLVELILRDGLDVIG